MYLILFFKFSMVWYEQNILEVNYMGLFGKKKESDPRFDRIMDLYYSIVYKNLTREYDGVE